MALIMFLVLVGACLSVGVAFETCSQCGAHCCYPAETCADNGYGAPACYMTKDKEVCSTLKHYGNETYCFSPSACCGGDLCCPAKTQCCGLDLYRHGELVQPKCCPEHTVCCDGKCCSKGEACGAGKCYKDDIKFMWLLLLLLLIPIVACWSFCVRMKRVLKEEEKINRLIDNAVPPSQIPPPNPDRYNQPTTALAPSSNPGHRYNQPTTARAPPTNPGHRPNQPSTARAPPTNPGHRPNQPTASRGPPLILVVIEEHRQTTPAERTKPVASSDK